MTALKWWMCSRMIYNHTRISLLSNAVRSFSQMVDTYLLARTRVSFAFSSSILLRILLTMFSRSTQLWLDPLLGWMMILDSFQLLGIVPSICGNLTILKENQFGNTLKETSTLLVWLPLNLKDLSSLWFMLQVLTSLSVRLSTAKIYWSMSSNFVLLRLS